jgi:3-methylcrotonyl-CoA carboxylase beta subunit
MSIQNLDFNKNEDHNKLLLSRYRQIMEKVALGGGKSRIEKLHSQGKMTARERINYLIDKDSKFLEIGGLVGYEMYEEHGGCPSGGVVGGIGYVKGRQCVIVANDATVRFCRCLLAYAG